MNMPYWKYKPYDTVDLPDRTWPERVVTEAPIWCSTDLRDGNQSLVKPMDSARKQRMFKLLVRLAVTVPSPFQHLRMDLVPRHAEGREHAGSETDVHAEQAE